MALTVLMIMTVILVFTWTENYGDKTTNISHSFTSAWNSIKTGELVPSFALHTVFKNAATLYIIFVRLWGIVSFD